MSSAIRHLSVCDGDPQFAAGEFEKVVHIYRFRKTAPETTIYTHFDFGGTRLQIVPRENVLVTGAYSVYGIEGYSQPSGRRLWQRRDLKKVQSIQWNPSDSTVCCFFADRECLVLDPCTGKELSFYPAELEDGRYNSDGRMVLQDRRSRYLVVRNETTLFSVEMESFGMLDAAFSEDCVAITEPCGSVRFYELTTGEPTRRYIPPSGYHVLSLAFQASIGAFVGVLWGYESTGDHYLVQLRPSGKETRRFGLVDAHTSTFLNSGQTILLASGQELCTETGREVFRYDFPERSDA